MKDQKGAVRPQRDEALEVLFGAYGQSKWLEPGAVKASSKTHVKEVKFPPAGTQPVK